jgi:hypothetical protein
LEYLLDTGIDMTPIVICTTGASKAIQVLLASIEQYVPRETQVYVYGDFAGIESWEFVRWLGDNDKKNFGDAYNYAMSQTFMDGHETVIIANDDVVLDPNTYWLITHDRVLLKQQGHKVGFLSARSNMASIPQNIRAKQDNDTWNGMKWASEDSIAQVEWTAPLFASVDRDGWPGFPPTNFFSDNVACADMADEGYKHFLSRAYVHHVGSSTIGRGHGTDSKNYMEAEDWLKLNRPLLHKRYFGSNL